MYDGGADFDSFFASASASHEADIAKARTGHFQRDCTWIVEHAQSSPDYLPGIVALVLCSIQQPFVQIDQAMADVAQHGTQSRFMWGWKPDGLRYVQRNKRAIWESAKRYAEGAIDLDSLILDYLAIPGLGIVKASFLAQMTVGDGACLDSHNLRSLGLAEDAFKLRKALKLDTVRQRIATYNATWRRAGDSSYWWDVWCDTVGNRTHNTLGKKVNGFFAGGGAEVSALHRLAITAGVK